MYQQNQGDMYTNAVALLISGTLISPESGAGLLASSGSTLANLPASVEAVVYASGGTYLGSAQTSTRGPGTGAQNDRIGASYRIRINAAGAVDRIQVVQTRPNGSLQGAPPATFLNPGSGPNMAVIGQTIIFDAASMSTAFGIQAPVITGALTITLLATDIQRPFSGVQTNAAAKDGIYQGDILSGGGTFALSIDGAAGGSSVKVELASAPPNQTVTITGIPPGTTLDGLFRKVYTTDDATTATGIIALY